MDVGLPSTAITLPIAPHLCPERESDLFSIGRIRTIFRIRERKFFIGATGGRHRVKLIESCLAAFTGGGEKDLLVIVGPINHAVRISMRCQALGNTTGNGNHVYIIVSIVIAGEG